VVATDVAPGPLELARTLGAEAALLAGSEPIGDVVERATEGAGAAAVLNSVGTPQSIADSMRLLQRGGRQILLALESGEVTLPLAALSGERVLTVSANNTYPEFGEALSLVAGGAVRCQPLITHHFPLAQAVEAFGVTERRAETGAIKVVLQP
jgi:threonine dehydrogenase-like Zn-dependent dehydrogenase